MYENRRDFLSYYRQLQEQARSQVLREDEDQILGTDIDELARYIYDGYAIAPIEIDDSRETSWDLQDYLQDIPARRRESFYWQEGDLLDFPSQRAVVEIPIKTNKDLGVIAGLQASLHSFSYSDSDFRWEDSGISRSFETKGYKLQLEELEISREVERTLQSIQDTIRAKNENIQQGNQELFTLIKSLIEDRKKKINQNKEKLSFLTKTINIPLKKRVSEGAHKVRVTHTPLVERIKPKPTLPEEFVLSEPQVNDVISLLDYQAKSFENTPRAFKSLGEEDLRDILLSNLNSVFQGAATGETFSKQGKTDIYLKIAKGQILICECKVWAGQALYDKTVDQLRSYLTWRHNYGIMITFVRIKDFTKVLNESEKAIQSHSSYKGGFRRINETHFVSAHKVDDEDRQVTMHHLFFHLYSGKDSDI
jgi:hypothetical protein